MDRIALIKTAPVLDHFGGAYFRNALRRFAFRAMEVVRCGVSIFPRSVVSLRNLFFFVPRSRARPHFARADSVADCGLGGRNIISVCSISCPRRTG